jgi:hypothetical protein
MILEDRMRTACHSQATTVATLSLRRFHFCDNLHRLNADARHTSEKVDHLFLVTGEAIKQAKMGERRSDRRKLYRGRGAVHDFLCAICLRKTEAMLLFSQSPD